jgi:hypothetical protein
MRWRALKACSFAAIEAALLRELVQGLGLSRHEIARRYGANVSRVVRRGELLSGVAGRRPRRGVRERAHHKRNRVGHR